MPSRGTTQRPSVDSNVSADSDRSHGVVVTEMVADGPWRSISALTDDDSQSVGEVTHEPAVDPGRGLSDDSQFFQARDYRYSAECAIRSDPAVDPAAFQAHLDSFSPTKLFMQGPDVHVHWVETGAAAPPADRPPGLPSPNPRDVIPAAGDGSGSDPDVGPAADGPRSAAPTIKTTPVDGSPPSRRGLARLDTGEGLTYAEYPSSMLLSAPQRPTARPLTPPSEHRRTGGLLQDQEDSSDENTTPVLKELEGSVEWGMPEAGIVERVRRLLREADPSADELEAIAQMSLLEAQQKRISAAPPSQGPLAQDAGALPPSLHGLGGLPPVYSPPQLGVHPMSVPPVAPHLQMPPPYGGMMPWAPFPPMYAGYPSPVVPEQQGKKKKDQCRKGEEYEPHPATQKALEEVPENKRTTIMLRNIPLNYSRDQVEDLLNGKGYRGKYDLLYLPRDFDKGANYGYAFINFLEHVDADGARKEFHQFKKWGNQSVKRAVVCWATSQGRERNLEKWKISSVMSKEVKECDQPMCYDRDGNKAPDMLTPDKEPRRPRPKKSNPNGAAKTEPQLPMPAYGGYAFPYGMPSPGMWPGAY